MSLHDKWGIGDTLASPCKDAGTGILVLVSTDDRVVFISRGSALETTLHDSVIDQIIELMGPDFRQGLYGRGIKLGLLEMFSCLERGPPSNWECFFTFCERYAQFTFMLGTLLYSFLSNRWQRKENMEYASLRTELSRMDRDYALSLQGKYQCSSCPICLEIFQGIDEKKEQCAVIRGESNENNEKNIDSSQYSNQTGASTHFVPTVGSDGLPLKLLRCGHVFDESCWQEYISVRDGDVHVCPICKQDLANTSNDQQIESEEQDLNQSRSTDVVQYENQNISTSDDSPNNDNNTELYQNERNFRLSRLQIRYPHFISRVTLRRWLNPRNNRGLLLARDRNILQRNPSHLRDLDTNRHQSASYSRSTRRFGSGRSSGGRGGRW